MARRTRVFETSLSSYSLSLSLAHILPDAPDTTFLICARRRKICVGMLNGIIFYEHNLLLRMVISVSRAVDKCGAFLGFESSFLRGALG